MINIAIEKKAKKLLEDFGVTSMPVPIENIISTIGIQVKSAPSDKYSGLLIRKEDGVVLMGLNSNESYSRRRFTMAHELGHYFLNSKKTAFVDQKITVDYRNFENKKNNVLETFANMFAAAILMPANFIKNDFNNIIKRGIFIDEHLSLLADKYQVSREAMKYRLKNLKLIEIGLEL